jgi:hypothetical protein
MDNKENIIPAQAGNQCDPSEKTLDPGLRRDDGYSETTVTGQPA